jgi:hypothetical protein
MANSLLRRRAFALAVALMFVLVVISPVHAADELARYKKAEEIATAHLVKLTSALAPPPSVVSHKPSSVHRRTGVECLLPC